MAKPKAPGAERRVPLVGREANPPKGAREWVSFPDPTEDRTWVFDITFLLSSWECIFGRGCQGVLTGPAPELAQGCCSYGAHFTGPEDVERVKRAATTLGPEIWQFATQARSPSGKLRIVSSDKAKSKGKIRGSAPGGVKNGGGGETPSPGTPSAVSDAETQTVSRIIDDACIFLNRPGFAAGPGCALHAAALQRGERPMDWKPDVCWQLPLRREDETDSTGHVTSTIRQWDRRHWGEGGAEFHWWCTEEAEAFAGAAAVYETLREELIELVGGGIYATIAAELERRRQPTTPFPHPAVPVAPPRRRTSPQPSRTPTG